MTTAISFSELRSGIRSSQPTLVIDVRRRPAFQAATDMIAGALDEGSGAISRLDTQVSSIGDTASRALTLPARRQDRQVAGHDRSQ